MTEQQPGARRIQPDSATPIDQESHYPRVWNGYSDAPDEMPLSGYAALLAAYLAAGGGVLGATGPRLPERIGFADMLMFGVATHKIGRIVTKDWVTSPLRAPFTQYVKSTGGGEVSERARGTGLRRAVGDLLTCPWCIAPWMAGGLYATFLVRPRAARLIAALFTSVALSDALQHGYSTLKKQA